MAPPEPQASPAGTAERPASPAGTAGRPASPAGTAERPAARVTASPQALALIEHLRATDGPLVFFQSGGCCAGSSPMCLPEGELPPGPNDLCLGEIGACPFYIDADQYRRWGEPGFVIDVSPGSEESFSLETREGVHFVTRTPR